MLTIRHLSAIALTASLLVPFVPVSASTTFNPNFVLSDATVRDTGSMSYMDIYRFLGEKGQLNTVFVEAPDYCSKGKPEGYDPDRDSIPLVKGVAQLVYDAAQCHGVSPKYILARLQMESSIVEAATLRQDRLDWAAGYALCDGCLKSSPLAQKYFGLARQVDVAAGWMDWFMVNHASLTYLRQPGVTYTISGQQVTPANLATAALYNYTPHVGDERIGGNQLLWRIWQRWWPEEAGTPARFGLPEGSLVRSAETGAVALVQNGLYRPVTSASVLVTRFANTNIIDLPRGEFDRHLSERPGRPVRFPDQSIVRTETGATYLLIGNSKRLIPSPEVFRAIGFNPEEVEEVLAADIEDYRDGASVAINEAYPGGALVQDTITGGVYFVDGGQKRPILDRGVLLANYPGRSIIPLAPVDLEKIPRGEPVLLNDGVLVKAPEDPTVYLIAGGQKRPIPTEEIFHAYSYRFTSVITVAERMLALHPTGPALPMLEVVVSDAPSVPSTTPTATAT